MRKVERQPYLDNGVYGDSLLDRLVENPPYLPLLKIIHEKEELGGPVLAEAKGEIAREGIDSRKKAQQFEEVLLRLASSSCGQQLPALLRDEKAYRTEKRLSGDVLIDAMVLAGEDMSRELVLLLAPEQTPAIRKDPHFTPVGSTKTAKTNGIGRIHNCTVLVCEHIRRENDGRFMSFLCTRGTLEASVVLTVLQERTRVEASWKIDISRLEESCCINILSAL